jgi:glutamate-1-semialdehyde 2,1-aminomutase
VLIYDEIKTACRVALGGAGERWGVVPDLVVLGKAIANGFPLAAVGGSAQVMDRVDRTWISSTLATEFVALAAAEATLETMAAERVPERLDRLGRRLYEGLARLAERFPQWIEAVRGMPVMCHLQFRTEQASARCAAGAARHQLLFKRSAYNFVSLAHQESDVDQCLAILDAVLGEMEAC